MQETNKTKTTASNGVSDHKYPKNNHKWDCAAIKTNNEMKIIIKLVMKINQNQFNYN